MVRSPGDIIDCPNELRKRGFCGHHKEAKCKSCKLKYAGDLDQCPGCNRITDELCFTRRTRYCRNTGALTCPNGYCYAHSKEIQQTPFKELPLEVPERYQSVMEKKRGDSHSLDDPMTLLHARLCELGSRIDTGESGDSWDKLTAIAMKMRNIVTRLSSAKKGDSILGDIQQLVTAGQFVYQTILDAKQSEKVWDDIYRLIDLQGRLAKVQVSSAPMNAGWMSIEQAKSRETVLVWTIIQCLHGNGHRQALIDLREGLKTLTNGETLEIQPIERNNNDGD